MTWSYCCCSEGELWSVYYNDIFKWDLSFDQPIADFEINRNTTNPREWWLRPRAPDGTFGSTPQYAGEHRFGVTMDETYIYILAWAKGGDDDPQTPYREDNDEVDTADYVIRVVDRNSGDHIRRILLKRGGDHYSQQVHPREGINDQGVNRAGAITAGSFAGYTSPTEQGYRIGAHSTNSGTGVLMMSKNRIAISGTFHRFAPATVQDSRREERYLPVWDREGNFLYEIDGSKFTDYDFSYMDPLPDPLYIYNPRFEQRMDAEGNIYVFSPSKTPDEKIYPGDTYWTLEYQTRTVDGIVYPTYPPRPEHPITGADGNEPTENNSFRWSGILPNVLTKYDTSGAEAWTLNLQTTLNDRASAQNYCLCPDGSAYIAAESMAREASLYTSLKWAATAPYTTTQPQHRAEIHKISTDGSSSDNEWPLKHIYRRHIFDRWGINGAWAMVGGVHTFVPFDDDPDVITMDGSEEHPFSAYEDWDAADSIHGWRARSAHPRATQTTSTAPNIANDQLGPVRVLDAWQVYAGDLLNYYYDSRWQNTSMRSDPSGNFWISHNEYDTVLGEYWPFQYVNRLSLIDKDSASVLDSITGLAIVQLIPADAKVPDGNKLQAWGFDGDNNFWHPEGSGFGWDVLALKRQFGTADPPARFLSGDAYPGVLYTELGNPFLVG